MIDAHEKIELPFSRGYRSVDSSAQEMKRKSTVAWREATRTTGFGSKHVVVGSCSFAKHVFECGSGENEMRVMIDSSLPEVCLHTDKCTV